MFKFKQLIDYFRKNDGADLKEPEKNIKVSGDLVLASGDVVELSATGISANTVNISGDEGVKLITQVTHVNTESTDSGFFGDKTVGGYKPLFHLTIINGEIINISSSKGTVDFFGAKLISQCSITIEALGNITECAAEGKEKDAISRTGLRYAFNLFGESDKASIIDRQVETEILSQSGQVNKYSWCGSIKLAGAHVVAGDGGEWYARDGVCAKGSKQHFYSEVSKFSCNVSASFSSVSVSLGCEKYSQSGSHHTPDTIEMGGQWKVTVGKNAAVELCADISADCFETNASDITFRGLEHTSKKSLSFMGVNAGASLGLGSASVHVGVTCSNSQTKQEEIEHTKVNLGRLTLTNSKTTLNVKNAQVSVDSVDGVPEDVIVHTSACHTQTSDHSFGIGVGVSAKLIPGGVVPTPFGYVDASAHAGRNASIKELASFTARESENPINVQHSADETYNDTSGISIVVSTHKEKEGRVFSGTAKGNVNNFELEASLDFLVPKKSKTQNIAPTTPMASESASKEAIPEKSTTNKPILAAYDSARSATLCGNSKQQEMMVSKEGAEFIKQLEGCKLKSYKCPSGVSTIGYGHTKGVKVGDQVTQKQAEKLFEDDLKRHTREVIDHLKVPVNQNQLDALVSKHFNIGDRQFKESTLLKKLNAGDFSGAAKEFLRWNKGTVGGKKIEIPGLTNRCQREMKKFLSPVVKPDSWLPLPGRVKMKI